MNAKMCNFVVLDIDPYLYFPIFYVAIFHRSFFISKKHKTLFLDFSVFFCKILLKYSYLLFYFTTRLLDLSGSQPPALSSGPLTTALYPWPSFSANNSVISANLKQVV